jgi:hypothetical protein
MARGAIRAAAGPPRAFALAPCRLPHRIAIRGAFGE